ALELLEALVRPLPLLGIEQADAYDLRGRILQSRASAGALAAYQQSLEIFARLTSDERAARLPRFHERFGDLLLNLNKLVQEHPADAGGHQLLMQALTFYFGLADRSLASGGVDVAGRVFDTLTSLLESLSEPDRRRITKAYQTLRDDLATRK